MITRNQKTKIMTVLLFLFLSFHISLAIDITNCMELNQTYAIYNLTQDIIDSSAYTCFDITANNVILDCGGHKIDGIYASNSYGIKIYRISSQITNISIKNCEVTNWYNGIYIENSDRNTLENVISSYNYWDGIHIESGYNELLNVSVYNNNYDGISLRGSSNTIINSIAENNYFGIDLYAPYNTLINITSRENIWDIYVIGSYNSVCDNFLQNVIGSNNLPILYYNYSVNLSNKVLSELILCNADNSTISNITINSSQTKENNGLLIERTDYSNFSLIISTNHVEGLKLLDSSYNNFSYLYIKNGYKGITMFRSYNNTFSNSTIKGNENIGLYLDSSNYNLFYNLSVVDNNFDAIIIENSSYNKISDSLINSNNGKGIYISYGVQTSQYSSYNTISNSHISNNNYGIYLDSAGSSGPNLIYNNFLNNTNNVYFYGTIYPNNWNTTKQEKTNIIGGNYLGGNFYAKPDGTGYSEICDDNNLDGICDSPYTLATNNTDYLPLTTLRIKNCTVITNPGEYILTQDIINSTNSTCIDIQANNVTLDCQGHKIDGVDSSSSYGIKIYRSSEESTNITIKNCVVTDWYDGIYLENSDGNKIENTTTRSNIDDGIRLYYSDFNTLTNIITNSNSDDGIFLYHSDSNTLTNITVKSNSIGIYLDSSSSNTLTNITTSLDNHGIRLDSSDFNIITNITSNSDNVGIHLSYSNSNTLTNITIQNSNDWDIYYATSRSDNDCQNSFQNVIGTGNKPILFFNTTTTIKNWNNNISEIILCHADNSTIDNLTLIGSGNNGLILIATYYTNISNSYFENLNYGLYLYSSNYNNLINISSNSNSIGIYLDSFNSNTLTNITANSNSCCGIYLFYSDSNTLTNSHISNNTQYGIYLSYAGSSDPNLIYNNFFNNTNNVEFDIYGTIYPNNWNTTKQEGQRVYSPGIYIGGNYWAKPDGTGYSETCDDTDHNGFCDLPYDIQNEDTDCSDSSNCDYLPLSNGYTSFSITLYSPNNLTITDDSTPDFDFSVVGTESSYSCDLFIDNIGYGSNNSVQNNTLTTITANQTISDGNHIWYINCTANSLTNQSEKRTITIDTISPLIQFTNPSTQSGNYSQSWIFANVTATDPNLKNTTIYLYNETSLYQQITGPNSTIYTNFTSLPDGIYYLNASAFDILGHYNQTETRTITLDTTGPTTTATGIKEDGNPYVFNTWTSSNYVNITLSCNDSGTGCNYTLYCVDTTDSCIPDTIYTTTIQISTEGISYIRFRSNDTVGNLEDIKSETVKIDTTPPQIQFVNPTTESGYHSQTWISANVTGSDTNLDTLTIYLYNKTSLYQQITTPNSTLYINFTSLPDGTYYLNATSNDTLGSTNSTETRTIILDTTSPLVLINTPSPNSILHTHTIEINLTSIDENLNYTNVSLINSTGNIVDSTITNTNGTYTISLSVPTDGKYNITATSYDLAGNMNKTAVSNITINTTYIEVNNCGILDKPNTNYYLTTDLINSISYCINITANNITFDCKNHRIESNGTTEYGIYISRISKEDANITIKNCIINNWNNSDIYLKNIYRIEIKNTTTDGLYASNSSIKFYSTNISNLKISNNVNISGYISVQNTAFEENSSLNRWFPIKLVSDIVTKTIVNRNCSLIKNNETIQNFTAGFSWINATFENSTERYEIFVNGYGIAKINGTKVYLTPSTDTSKNITIDVVYPKANNISITYVFISPQTSLGIKDNTTINFTESETLNKRCIFIKDPNSSIIYESCKTGKFVWNGTNINGEEVNDGNYSIWINITDLFENNNITNIFNVTVDNTLPEIYENIPVVTYNGTQIYLEINVSDLYENTSFVNISSPHENSTISFKRHLNITQIFNYTDNYTVRIISKDLAGNIQQLEKIIVVRPEVYVNISVTPLTLLNITFLYNNYTINESSSYGGLLIRVPKWIYITNINFNNSLEIYLNDSNFTNVEQPIILIDIPNITNYLTAYAISTSFNFSISKIRINYTLLPYTNDNYLGVYRCNYWNFSSNSCDSTWEKINATINTSSKTIEFNTTHFSAFAVNQEPYCGDGIKNQASEECDGSDFGGKTCSDFGYNSGTLQCTSDCRIITTSCSNTQTGSSSSTSSSSSTYIPIETCKSIGYNCSTNDDCCSKYCFENKCTEKTINILLDCPSQIKTIEGNITIKVKVKNEGNVEYTSDVIFNKIKKSIVLKPYQEKEIGFQIFKTPGNYTLRFSTVNDTCLVSLIVEENPVKIELRKEIERTKEMIKKSKNINKTLVYKLIGEAYEKLSKGRYSDARKILDDIKTILNNTTTKPEKKEEKKNYSIIIIFSISVIALLLFIKRNKIKIFVERVYLKYKLEKEISEIEKILKNRKIENKTIKKELRLAKRYIRSEMFHLAQLHIYRLKKRLNIKI